MFVNRERFPIGTSPSYTLTQTIALRRANNREVFTIIYADFVYEANILASTLINQFSNTSVEQDRKKRNILLSLCITPSIDPVASSFFQHK